ncbi:MAG: endopeptidase La, partial [Candidatus Babeliales bacterium]
ELKRLEMMTAFSSEAVVTRHYIDWILSLPWNEKTVDTISLTQAEKLLNQHHAGLQRVKDRILEFLAAQKFSKKETRSPILCLVGPPGVGKTSLAKSIAESMNREFVRIALGGIKDEAEIRGHRRTYIGALPGKIIQAMKKAKTVNPVILLDEIDKISRDFYSDPSAALLEVLDPEQNSSFSDHFLDLDYDLSHVIFIATANMLEDIPYPLFDRLEIITLPGYTEQEKLTIARKFLIPKNLHDYNVSEEQWKIAPTVIKEIIEHYTKEAGVRQLDRILAKLIRKSIQFFLKNKKTTSITVTSARLIEWLGHYKFRKTSLSEVQEKIGVATGLAWTELGGDVLEIEATALPGKGNLTLTGQLGEVMQESAQAALSYIRSRAQQLGLARSFYTTKDIHIHIPEGATRKDGPSAGITMCCALISALTRNPLLPSLAMTGEITLQGRILAIGGLKEKILAALLYRKHKVIIPKENSDDLKELEKEIDMKELHIVMVNTMDEVVKEAFVKDPLKLPSQKKRVKKSAKL